MNNFETYLQHICDALQDSKVKDAMQYSLMAGEMCIRDRYKEAYYDEWMTRMRKIFS